MSHEHDRDGGPSAVHASDRGEPCRLDEIEDLAIRLEGVESLDPLTERIGDARFVLIALEEHPSEEMETYPWGT